jgi:predicted RNA-binding Zn ribbon-like protein
MNAVVIKAIADIDVLGGHPALDFVNTVHSRFTDGDSDYLRSYADVVAWHERLGLVPNATGKQLLATVRDKPELAAQTLQFSREVRELLYRIFINVIHQRAQNPSDLDQLNRILNSLRCCQQLVAAGQGMRLQWHIDPSRPQMMLGPVVESAVELLTSDRLDRVKECPAPDGCGWLFLDTSRNGSRCWCSMKYCGNLAKVRRHRKKAH